MKKTPRVWKLIILLQQFICQLIHSKGALSYSCLASALAASDFLNFKKKPKDMSEIKNIASAM